MWVTHVSISDVYGPISTKFGMKVGLWTLMKGKIQWSSFLGNGCYGNEKNISQLMYWPDSEESVHVKSTLP